MKNSGTERAKKTTIIGSFSTIPGVTVSFEQGEASDYLQMRTAQLSALSEVVNDEGFALWDQHIQSNVRWIVTSLAEEVESLVPIALREARRMAHDEIGEMGLQRSIPAGFLRPWIRGIANKRWFNLRFRRVVRD